jgi:carboxyl-terminal processing protease
MSLKVRGILVLVIGTVLGLAVSISSSMLAERGSRSAPVPIELGLGDESLALLAEALARVRSEYVDAIDDQTLVENAIKGMLDGLDQHSRFLSSDQYEDIQIATRGSYSGVGLNIDLLDGKVVVLDPMEDAPAAKAGIRAGDVVVSVDDIPVAASNLEDAVNRMRGQPGTEVRLGVTRGPNQSLLNFSVTRAPIKVATVRGEFLAGGYGYLRLSGFTDSTLAELYAAADSLMRESDRALNGLVLDLRDNPGGLLDAAVGVADAFLDDGLIVRGNGRIRQSRFEQYAEPGDALESVPLAVLINRGSASGSEIVAGALKDHQRAELIGQRSYGKGSVQSVVPLGAGSALKLTTAHYLTPSGISINGLGIEPDIVIRNTDPRQQFGRSGSLVPIADDLQLSRALESLGYEAITLSQAR